MFEACQPVSKQSELAPPSPYLWLPRVCLPMGPVSGNALVKTFKSVVGSSLFKLLQCLRVGVKCQPLQRISCSLRLTLLLYNTQAFLNVIVKLVTYILWMEFKLWWDAMQNEARATFAFYCRPHLSLCLSTLFTFILTFCFSLCFRHPRCYKCSFDYFILKMNRENCCSQLSRFQVSKRLKKYSVFSNHNPPNTCNKTQDFVPWIFMQSNYIALLLHHPPVSKIN